ncbi:hypothetical protein COCNU_01G013850 [Cocos nucifera]|uniref:BSD domain-containing protein n=1 Tax=Cocos nucifera TaxID=13894 RepID=A0A8K0HVM9_COCNU|nr:hypothetical protein COCNU_01G013850 [Cocos nucifera]
MDLWERARVFAEEAAKRSQEISKEAAKRSQELTKGAAKFSQEFVSETAKKSKELAAEATKKADLIRSEALRAADQIKTLAVDLPTLPISPLAPGGSVAPDPALDLERFGITDELRDFVKGINLGTFRDFPMQVTLLKFYVDPISYEKKYMEELKMKAEQKQKDNLKENTTVAPATKAESKESKLPSKTSTSLNTEHDLDVFLLGDLGSDDDGPDDCDGGLDDEFDKIGSNSGLDGDDDERKSKASKAANAEI